MDETVYTITTNYKEKVLTVPRLPGQTVKHLKEVVVEQMGLEQDNIRIFVNGKTLQDTDDTLLIDVFHEGDALKVIIPNNLITGTNLDIVRDMNAQIQAQEEEAQRQEVLRKADLERRILLEPEERQKQIRELQKKNAEKLANDKRINDERTQLLHKQRAEAQLRRQQIKQYKIKPEMQKQVEVKPHRQKEDLKKDEGKRWAESKKQQKEPKKFDQPTPSIVQPPQQAGQQEVKSLDPMRHLEAMKMKKMGSPHLLNQDNPFSVEPPQQIEQPVRQMNPGTSEPPGGSTEATKKQGKSQQKQEKEPKEEQSGEDKSQKKEKENNKGNGEDKGEGEDDKDKDKGNGEDKDQGDDKMKTQEEKEVPYEYIKNIQQILTPQQQFKRVVDRLKSLEIENPEYWATISLSDEDIAEALSRCGAKTLEPIVHIQMQRHVMNYFLKKMLVHQHIKDSKPRFQTRPQLLQHFFGHRLTYPVRSLKLLMQNRKKQFLEHVKHWFEVDDKAVLSKQEQQSYIEELPKYTDKTIVQQLRKLASCQEQAIKMAEISQNDLQFAIMYSTKGEACLEDSLFFLMTDYEKKEVGLLEEFEEQIFLFRWLFKRKSYIFQLRVQAEPNFLHVYILSMRHICPSLFRMLVKNLPFIQKLLKKYPPEKYKRVEAPLVRVPKPEKIYWMLTCYN